MYPNVNAECARKGITRKFLAQQVLHITPGTLSKKLKKRNGFSFEEAQKIQEYLNPGMDLNKLFEFDSRDEVNG